jgi:nucleoside-diphosphate-sugar epimerase
MTIATEYDLVVGAGPLGIAVARELKRRGRTVKIGTRTGTGFDETRCYLPVDLQSPRVGAKELEGVRTLFLCCAPAYWRWGDELVPMVKNAMTLAQELNVPLLFADNMYAYGEANAPLTETTPYNPRGAKGEARRRAAELLLEAHRRGRATTAIVRAADFYGPFVARSMLGTNVFRVIAEGGRANVLGDVDVPHSYTFVDDFAQSLVNVAMNADCHGEVWHAATAPALSMRKMLQIMARGSGAPPKFRVAPRWLFLAMGMFDRSMRELREVYHQYTSPFVVDSGKYHQRFNEEPTPVEEAIRRTFRSVAENLGVKRVAIRPGRNRVPGETHSPANQSSWTDA